jgi:hypothetical protein
VSAGEGLGPLERRFFDSHDAGVQALGAAGERVSVAQSAEKVASSSVASKEEAVADERRDGKILALEGRVKVLEDRADAQDKDSKVSKWTIVGVVVLPLLGTGLGALLMWLISSKPPG